MRTTTLFLTCLLGWQLAFAQKLSKSKIDQLLDTASVLNQSFTGFMLIDPANGEVLYERNADKYMTPASNTKLYTYYTATHILGNALPALKYETSGDSLIFWGTGYPLLLNPDFNDSTALKFLAGWKGKLFYRHTPFDEGRFGAGWSWDDYNTYYSSELAPFPIHANNAVFELKGDEDSLKISPSYFEAKVNKRYREKGENERVIQREEFSNKFTYLAKADTFLSGEEIFRPFMWSDEVFAGILEEKLKRPVEIYESPVPMNGKILYSQAADTMYRKMLQESDNFLAEQILIMCSAMLSDTLGSERAIEFAADSLMADFPDEPIWVDGSGLSRYNMFTPRTTVDLLLRLYQKVGTETLFDYLPTSGQTGTIKNWYKANRPYIHAKTGTLSNNHCLSGYLVTDKGKVLVFSYMQNHYTAYSSQVKRQMELVFKYIKENL
ncbi:D-alanyl-D-alanine carboxypeptidase [Flammeovirgaceae bacterium SG7u.111]|nr:D-alanyl-D-alanine carboxypeptidase [Flammeovirgaceae bacterium SG7u.132]WPO36579.1 D-alanyl-D-alanine carboxypeptidase [Flammeovirgaceae bacterium SG7u.111]